MSIHFFDKCKHGVIVRQCRCPDKNKLERIVSCPLTCYDDKGGATDTEVVKRLPNKDPNSWLWI